MHVSIHDIRVASPNAVIALSVRARGNLGVGRQARTFFNVRGAVFPSVAIAWPYLSAHWPPSLFSRSGARESRRRHVIVCTGTSNRSHGS